MLFFRSASPETDPSGLLRLRDGLYAPDLLITAVAHLDLFNLLVEGPLDLNHVCSRLGIAARPADVMMTLFTALGLTEKERDGYALTLLGREFLTAGSPWDLSPYLASLKERPICRDILGVLRSDRPFGWANRQEQDAWARAMQNEPFASAFTAAMDSRGAYLAPAMARALDCSGQRRLLDIAGGSGIYACAMATEHPHLRAAVFEKPPVDAVTRRAIDRFGLGDRVEVVAGDMFTDDLPEGFDLHLYSNVLHDWGENTVEELLRKSFAALPPGARLLIHDAHLQADKSGPLEVAEYSVLLMLASEGKCYSVGEMEQMLRSVGFQAIRHLPTVAFRSLIVADKSAA
jgi:SAM-dependent methyltransferase